MPIHDVADLDSPVLEPYRNMRSRNWTQGSGIFIAEGEALVRSLLNSRYATQSILIDRKYLPRYQSMLNDECNCYVVPTPLVSQLLGFHFHRGVMGCGIRKDRQTVAEGLPQPLRLETTLAVLVGIEDPENMGCILRTCSGLGIESVVIGPGCCDPFSRRALRVSMGNTFRLNLMYSSQIVDDLRRLSQLGVETIAACLTEQAVSLHTSTRNAPSAILLGNERRGLPEDVLRVVDRHIQIDMALGTSSLNVAVASGIMLHHFSRVADCSATP